MANLVADKSFDFAVNVVLTYQKLLAKKNEFSLFGQFMRCGTSIGANIAEAGDAQSKADFIAKMYISLKESKECIYWIRLLNKTNYLEENEARNLISECESLSRLLTSIIKSTKNNLELKK